MTADRNRLAEETSPYLLQHRDNPVHWWPWGEEALAAARARNQPILLSVGYSACHWCHVMAHESFEKSEIAALMNRDFINIILGFLIGTAVNSLIRFFYGSSNKAQEDVDKKQKEMGGDK